MGECQVGGGNFNWECQVVRGNIILDCQVEGGNFNGGLSGGRRELQCGSVR